MNARVKSFHLLLFLSIMGLLSSCVLPSQATTSPAEVENTAVEVKGPTQTPVTLPLQTSAPVQASPTPQTVVSDTPTAAPPPTNTPLPTSTPVQITDTTAYGVVLVLENDVLNVHAAAGANAAVTGSLAYNEVGIELTGNQATVSNAEWVEVRMLDGKTGWVNAHFLTEMVLPEPFCTDPRVQTLLDSFKKALDEKDGNLLASLISPAHGLSLRYFRGGTIANYSPEEAGWVFNSQYAMNWGAHPASGLEVKGTFSAEVLPKLLDVFDASYEKNCAGVSTGGASYDTSWPQEYTNINYVSAFRPGAAGDELNWRTWLVGIEYVDDQPYLFALEHLFWEP